MCVHLSVVVCLAMCVCTNQLKLRFKHQHVEPISPSLAGHSTLLNAEFPWHRWHDRRGKVQLGIARAWPIHLIGNSSGGSNFQQGQPAQKQAAQKQERIDPGCTLLIKVGEKFSITGFFFPQKENAVSTKFSVGKCWFFPPSKISIFHQENWNETP